jgi:hypothetical protein
MGILETLKSFLAMEPESTGKERIMAENLTAEQADKYMEEKMLFTPRMFKVINQLAPQAGKTFADFYESIWADGNLPRKIFEAAAVGMMLAGFVPNGNGIPYAFEYAAKCVEIAQKMEAGEDWEYLKPPKFDHGVF